MIRQLCPSCLKLAELPDSAAGSTVSCPICAKPFSVPGNYSPSVDPNAGPGVDPRKSSSPSAPEPTPARPDIPPPPPGFVPPPQAVASAPVTPTPQPVSAGPPTDGSYPHSFGVSLSPRVLEWIPVGCLTLILILTVFPWVGSYPGGTKVYSQYPWQAIFGNFECSIAPEDVLKDETAIAAKIGWNLWLMLYLPLLMATVFLAWVERLIHNPKVETVPPILAWLPTIWPSRFSLLAGLSLMLFLILLFQLWRGFGLEVAIKQIVLDKYAEELTKATTTPAKQRLSVQMGQELSAKGLQGTLVLNLVLVAHLVAIVTIALRWWLDKRGPSKPTPWIGVRF